MNKAESARLAGHFARLGYEASAKAEDAELIVLNTCVVRQSAEGRARAKIASLRSMKKLRPELSLAVTGCLVGLDSSELEGQFPYVDHFFGPGESPRWLEEAGTDSATLRRSSPVAFVPIIRGCNNFCTYCVVPYRRGREKSRPPEEIIAEAEELAAAGVKEVTLVGQNVDSYGHDLPDSPDLAYLLEKLNNLASLARIRFLTNHPKDMSLRLIKSIAALPRVCEEISLPVQAASDTVLEAMGRGYTAAHYRQLVAEIHREIAGVAINTDVIVGFPGESEAQFRETLDLLGELKFDKVHAAAYSPRPETFASRRLEDDVTAEEKRRRLRLVEELEAATATEINARLLGSSLEVLVEGRKGGRWWGRTRSGKLVFFTDPGDYLGRLVMVQIDKTSPWALQGNLVK